MRRTIWALAIAATLFSFTGARAGVTRTASDTYTGTIETGTACKDNNPTGINIGGACFEIFASEIGSTVAISVQDDNFPGATGGAYTFEDAGGNLGSAGFFCNAASVEIPTGAVRLIVTVDTLVNLTPLQCGALSPATTGTITIAISAP